VDALRVDVVTLLPYRLIKFISEILILEALKEEAEIEEI